MVKKFVKTILIIILAVVSVAGLWTGLEEYAKSYVREAVKEDILEKTDSGVITYEVPAGDYLAVEGEESTVESSAPDSVIEISGYGSGEDHTRETLHLEGVIEIPSLGIEEPVWKENSYVAMRYGVILLKNTAKLEQPGNAVIVGHRNTVTHTVFDKLTKINKDDAAVITLPDGSEHKYRVNGTYYCSPYDLQDYVGTSSEYPVMITLVTCAREKGNSWRFIVTLIPCED